MEHRNARFLARSMAPSASLLVTASLVLGGCAVGTAEGSGPEAGVRVMELPQHTAVLASDDPAELALTASQTFFRSAPVVVLADAGDDVARGTAAATAIELAAPALLSGGGISGGGLAEELRRLGATSVVAVGEGAAAVAAQVADDAGAEVVTFEARSLDAVAAAAAGASPSDTPTPTPAPLPDPDQLDPADLEDLRAQLPPQDEPQLLSEALALVDPAPGQEAAIGTVAAAGAVPFLVPGGDPGASAEAVDMLAESKALSVVGIGASFGPPEEFAWQVAAAETGERFASGTQRLFPARYVATAYTVPLDDGEPAEDPAEIVAEAGENAVAFAAPDAAGPPVGGAIALTAGTRASSAGSDGDHVTEVPHEALQPVIDAARAAGQYVLLEVVPGNRPLVEEVKELEPLLAQPGVGLALHPEQRVAGNGARRAGQVDVAEVQAVVDFLSEVVTEAGVPQSMVVVHQTTASSVLNRGRLTQTPQVAAVVLADAVVNGAATGPITWSDVTKNLPTGARLGWSAPAALPRDAVGLLPAEPAVPDVVVAS